MMFNDVTEEEIWSFVNVNVASVVAMTKIVLPQMLARKRGAIVNISSGASLHPFPLSTVYSATKVSVSYLNFYIKLHGQVSFLRPFVMHP